MKQSKLGGWFKHIFFILVFLILPLVVCLEITDNFFQQKYQQQLESSHKELDTKLQTTRVNFIPDAYLKKVSENSFHTLINSPSSEETNQYCKDLQARLPVPFDLYLYKNGKLITPNFIKLRSRFVGNRIWDILNQKGTKQVESYKKHQNFIENLLGKNISLYKLKEGKEVLTPIRVNLKDGEFYYKKDPKQPNSGLMFIFWEIPTTQSITKEIFEQEKGNYNHFSISSNDTEAVNPEVFRQIVYLNEKTFIDKKQNLWKSLTQDDQHILGSISIDNGSLVLKNYFSILLIILTLAALVSYIAYHLNWFTFISIKYKIAVLFYMSFFIALVGFWQLGTIYIQNKEKAAIVEITNQARMYLSKVDTSLRLESRFFLNRYNHFNNLLYDYENVESMKEIDELISTNELIGAGLMTASDSVYILNKLNEYATKEHSTLFTTALKIALDNKYGSKLAEEDDQSMVKLLTNPELGFIYLIKLPGFPHLVNFSNYKMLAYWDTQTINGVTLCASIITSYDNSMAKSAQELVEKLYSNKEMRPYTIAYVDQSSKTIFPKEFENVKPILDYNEILFHSEAPTEFIATVKDANYFITGIKSKFAENFCFYAAYPLDLHEKQSFYMKVLFFAAFIFFTLAAFFSEKLLTAFFIKPVEELTKGVEELSAKNTEHRIEHKQNDELGDLALQFNSILGGLKEMELAQNVQESLLPAGMPQIDGYDLAYANRMASAVGGDYFDVFMLDEDHLCAIIGDVSGHGVASALVMAMVKATLYHGFKEKDDLLKLFEDVNTALISYFNRPGTKKMITLFACFFHTKTGEGLFTNAGHNFPFIVAKNGEIRELALIHLPLGTVKKVRRLKTLEFKLDKGESLLLYTDGIVEIQGNKPEQYGYIRFKNKFSELRHLSAKEIIDGKVKAYDEWLGDGEPDDDFTIAVIKRN
jgi:serine phosphatase RsbU (regulator of sigma subunit)